MKGLTEKDKIIQFEGKGVQYGQLFQEFQLN
jgi:hypothetical protein